MADTMTPSVMTDGQIDKAADVFRTALRKQRNELPSDAVQQVLGSDFASDLLTAFRRRVEALSGIIIRSVSVDRARSPEQMLKATGRTQYVEKDVVKTMPRGDGETAGVHFFKVGRFISDDDLEKEYELRGLVPADPCSLAAVNEADPAFADDHPNGTHWKDKNGKWCFAAFRRWSDERHVSVYRSDYDWNGSWWFAGLRK